MKKRLNLPPNIKFSKKELSSLKLPERINALEVAKKIKFPTRTNAHGSFDITLTPYLEFPIRLIGHYKVEWVIVIAPTQSGKTVYLQVVVADTIDQSPRPMIYAMPDEGKGKKVFSEKVLNLIKQNDFLKKHTSSLRDLNTTEVNLDNMPIYLAWSNSPSSVSSTSAGVVIADEVRTWNLEIKKEANALKQLNDRLTTYTAINQGQGFAVSSPSTEDDLLHQQTQTPGTVNLWWHIKCKKCNKFFLPDFFRDLLAHYDKEKNKAHMKCPFCLHEFTDTDRKKEMNRGGTYGPKGFHGATEPIPDEDMIKYRVAVYWCSLSSPFRTFNQIVREFFNTHKKTNDYKNFWMCWLARFWVNDKSKTSKKAIEKRKKKNFRKGMIPTNCRFLTAGVDSQGAGFYVVIRAFCSGGLTYLIDEFVINAPASTSSWEQVEQLFLEKIVNKVYTDKDKVRWKVAYWGIDTQGNRTRQVQDATSNLDNCIRVSGATEGQKTDITFNTTLNQYSIKTKVYAEETEFLCMQDEWILPEDVSDDYCEQYVNLRKVEETHPKDGSKKIFWKKINNNNDFRMADIYAMIPLDIDIEDGFTLRDRWTSEIFRIINPAQYDTIEDDLEFAPKKPSIPHTTGIEDAFMDEEEDYEEEYYDQDFEDFQIDDF